ncbi:hypothetical protein AAFN88_14960 [Pelagibius sp. CAU 1746]|uniref:hypothetical protein n=1 Tax=Pelagibius sp. CAU 1746 TaxID=3140370 RepID=UPI00325BC2FE
MVDLCLLTRWSGLAGIMLAGLIHPVFNFDAAAESLAAGVKEDPAYSLVVAAEDTRLALKTYDHETFMELLSHNPGVVDYLYPNGFTLLEEAAYVGNLPAVEALLLRGVDPDFGRFRPLSLALPGLAMDLRVPAQSPVTRGTFYRIIIVLLEAGADYRFLEGLETAFMGEPWSFVEGLVMDVCDPKHYSVDHLAVFREADIHFRLERKFLRNMKKIRALAKIGLANPACVAYFDSRIIPLEKT